MRIIGIDPGIAIMGYCVLDWEDSHKIIDCGSIQTCKENCNPKRLLEIHNDLVHLLKTYQPDAAAVEQLFYFKNAKTITPVSEARGVILMTLEMLGIPVFEYTPLVVKQTITGYGRADKCDVKDMVKLFFEDQDIPRLDDTTDAIAIAVCQTIMERDSRQFS